MATSSTASAPAVPAPPDYVAAAVFGEEYKLPYLVDLAVVRKFDLRTDGSFTICDIKDKLIFEVKGHFFTIHDRRYLRDSTGRTLATFYAKTISLHDRWKCYRGDSTDDKDLIFTAKRSKVLQLKAKLDVFMARNTEMKVCDFRVEGTLSQRSCTVYVGESNTLIAHMYTKTTLGSILLDKERFNLTVYPNVDYAFITALIIILDAINEESE